MSLGELGQGISGDDVSTDQLHRRIVIGDLLTEDGTRKHGVEPDKIFCNERGLFVKDIVLPAVLTKINLYWQFIFGIPNRDLSLLHDLLDVQQRRKSHTSGSDSHRQR